MRILVTGGCGYIGSHTVVELIRNGYDVVIVDDFSNSKPVVLDRIKEITGKSVTFFGYMSYFPNYIFIVYNKQHLQRYRTFGLF